MNLLPFVIAFLMVLTAITYSRMESLKTLVPSTVTFRQYTQSHQRFSQNEEWEKVYDDIHVKEVSNTQKVYSINGSAKLNLKSLFAKDNSPPEKKKAYRDTFARMIVMLHRDEPYFIAAMEQNPDWIEQLLNELGNKEAKALKDLNELTLNDPFLDSMLYHLMKEEKSIATFGTFYSKDKLSVFLASKPLLLAIYQDERVVDEIQNERRRISKEARKSNSDMEGLKKQFEELKSIYPSSFDPYLCFDISKTNISSP